MCGYQVMYTLPYFTSDGTIRNDRSTDTAKETLTLVLTPYVENKGTEDAYDESRSDSRSRRAGGSQDREALHPQPTRRRSIDQRQGVRPQPVRVGYSAGPFA